MKRVFKISLNTNDLLICFTTIDKITQTINQSINPLNPETNLFEPLIETFIGSPKSTYKLCIRRISQKRENHVPIMWLVTRASHLIKASCLSVCTSVATRCQPAAPASAPTSFVFLVGRMSSSQSVIFCCSVQMKAI